MDGDSRGVLVAADPSDVSAALGDMATILRMCLSPTKKTLSRCLRDFARKAWLTSNFEFNLAPNLCYEIPVVILRLA